MPLQEVGDGELSRVLRRPVLEGSHAIGSYVFGGLCPTLVVKPAHVETPSGDGHVILPATGYYVRGEGDRNMIRYDREYMYIIIPILW